MTNAIPRCTNDLPIEPPNVPPRAPASDLELHDLYRALAGTPHLDVVHRLVHAAQAHDEHQRQAWALLQATQVQAPTIAWAQQRDALLMARAW